MDQSQTIITTVTLKGPKWVVDAVVAACVNAAYQRVLVEMSVISSVQVQKESERDSVALI